jgi:branched-chain amino acid transport system substrate-binding protein
VDAFADPWVKANGSYPPQFAFDGATGIQLLVAAIEKADSADRDKVRDALEKLDELTPTGRFQFSSSDHGGLGTDDIAIVTVVDGDFKATDYSLARFETDLPS